MSPPRGRYLAEIAETVRGYHATTAQQSGVARRVQHLRTAATMLAAEGSDATPVEALLAAQEAELHPEVAALLKAWPTSASSTRRTSSS